MNASNILCWCLYTYDNNNLKYTKTKILYPAEPFYFLSLSSGVSQEHM